MKAKGMKVLRFFLKLPLVLLVLASWGASFYAAVFKIQGITWATPITMTIIIGLFIAGKILERFKKERVVI